MLFEMEWCVFEGLFTVLYTEFFRRCRLGWFHKLCFPGRIDLDVVNVGHTSGVQSRFMSSAAESRNAFN